MMYSTVCEHANRKKKLRIHNNKEKEKRDRMQMCMQSDARREEDIS